MKKWNYSIPLHGLIEAQGVSEAKVRVRDAFKTIHGITLSDNAITITKDTTCEWGNCSNDLTTEHANGCLYCDLHFPHIAEPI